MMCFAYPGKLISLEKEKGIADFGGVSKEVCLAFLSHAKVGDYVLVHAGFAIEIVEEERARFTIEAFDSHGTGKTS